MIAIADRTLDPYWNLAAEEYIFDKFEGPVVRLWRNDDSIILGRNQNAYAEVNLPYVREHKVKVVRRLSGGGAVFHDPGNVNYSFFNFDEDSPVSFTDPVIKALRGLGLDVCASGRNDLLLDGYKISGTAVYRSGRKLLQHGTLLYDASIDSLSEALVSRPEKFVGKSVKSVRSRVTNISKHLKTALPVEDFFVYMAGCLMEGAEEYVFTDADRAAIDHLRDEKYATDVWNYGKSPAFTSSRIKKFPAGLLELYIEVRNGAMAGVQISGDYFFSRPTGEFCEKMLGCGLSEKEIADRIDSLQVGEYFHGISSEELLSLFVEAI